MNKTKHTGDIYIYTESEINQAAEKAAGYFEEYKRLPVARRIFFLEAIASEISFAKEMMITTAQQETSLPEARLRGEIDRTINQVKLFIALLQEGSWVNAIIDTALPGRLPLPRADIRQMQQALGVVAVFGASNFPFAFSVAGGDTIAALAAGCPVLYKIHNGHPSTSKLVGRCIRTATLKAGIPQDVFSLLSFSSNERSIQLVTHPLVKAVAFTGSFKAGKALFDAAAGRPEPIPVYAEMGSVNPVFILPGKMKQAFQEVAASLVLSNTVGGGQFCTNPGLLIMVGSADTENFSSSFKAMLAQTAGSTMLTEAIYESYSFNIDKMKKDDRINVLCQGRTNGVKNEAVPYAFSITGKTLLDNKEFSEECFGPSSIHVIADDKEQLFEIASNLSGQLTASVWATEEDCREFEKLFHILENKAGRLIINNAPTGVEVSHAMVHGGPFPATTDSRSTSVGSSAIYRFTRPVCYQNFPPFLLPPELRDENPLSIKRKINGEMVKVLTLSRLN